MAVIVMVGVVAVGGLFAMRSLRAEPAPPVREPTRVVQVDVQPSG